MSLSAACRANIGQSLGASGAMRTRPEYAQRAAVWRARDPRRGAESRRHSAAPQPSRGLEGCQTAARGAYAGLVHVAPLAPRDRQILARQTTFGSISTTVVLGRFHEFGLFLGPLRRLLFFRRQGCFLLIFPLIFDFFGHGVRSQYVWGVFFGSTHDYTALWGNLSSGIIVYSVSEYAERLYRKLPIVGK